MLVAPDSKVHGANVGPIWGRQDPVGPHVGPMNLAIWGSFLLNCNSAVSFAWNFKCVLDTYASTWPDSLLEQLWK